MFDSVIELRTDLFIKGNSKPIVSVYSRVPVPAGKLLSAYDRVSKTYSVVPFVEGIAPRIASLLPSWLPCGYSISVSVAGVYDGESFVTASASDTSIVHDIISQILGFFICYSKF